MNWERLKKPHLRKDPVEHIYTAQLFDISEYDKLYENQNNLNHSIWHEFDAKYKVPFQFYEDIREINKDKEVICLWFFRDRNDRTHGNDILLANTKIRYFQNTFLITDCKDIKVLENGKKQYIRRPFIQIDLSKRKYKELLEKLR